ncbi:F-box only protein 15 [Strongylocentrotus purpuratus]|uniref:F-box domain-containing protein n=1 Tax=Strongylocentrotus purpuratus TaxID=7668 RepID=A0A7M7HP86_STRPU|nr:F-box only protein 15 [Strongylocentrotus purpuratus]XP_030831593.1 F-box only protein 15 [Strongylocentrotus purpuratus]
MADASSPSRHGRDLADYLGKHRRQQKQGYASPKKSAQVSRDTQEMPRLEKLRLRDASPPSSSSSSPSRGARIKPMLDSSSQSVKRGTSAPLPANGRGRGRGVRPVGRLNQQPVRSFKRKATMDDLPTEVLLHVFSFLPPSDLLTCVCINRQWMELASDNVLWQPLYQRYATRPSSKTPSTKKETKPNLVYSLHADIRWKKACIKECIEKRNSRISTLLKKKHPFSFLPANTEKTIQKLGIQWQLVFTDANKTEHRFNHSDAFHFHTSSSVRWYSLDPPPVTSLRCLAIYAQAPIFFNKDGSAAKNSPCQRALLLEQRIKPSDLTKHPIVKSDAINVYTIDGGIILATWKEGGEVAFVSLCLHHHGIIQRAVYGTSERMHIPAAIKPKPDDVDSEYGLHDYTCIMELRNQRTSFWSQQFLRLHANKQEKVDGFIRFSPVRGDVLTDHSYTTKKIQFPWKTDVFKGIIQDFAVLDCTIFDEFQQLMWCISSPVMISPDENAPVTMEYDGEPYVINHSAHKGHVEIRTFWIPDRGQHIMVAVNIDIAVKTINDWFGTRY